jgi:energy-coupling factor transporter ATP-binding protein EcfA2
VSGNNFEEARQRALERRQREITAVVDDPAGHGWPHLSLARLLEGADGVSRSALANALGCTTATVRDLMGEAVGKVLDHNNRAYDVFDPDLLYSLADHPLVIASRDRRSSSVTDQDRRDALDEAFQHRSGFEIRSASISNYHSIKHVFLPVDPLTVLFGRNGAGKSSIIDALDGIDFESGTEVQIEASFDHGLEADDVAELACYLSLGYRPTTREQLEAVLFELLSAPVAIGRSVSGSELGPLQFEVASEFNPRRPFWWAMGVRSDTAAGCRDRLHELVSKNLSGRVVPGLLEAAYAAIDEPMPVVEIPFGDSPAVEVTSLQADPAGLEGRLFAAIGEAVESFVSQGATNLKSIGAHREGELESGYGRVDLPKQLSQATLEKAKVGAAELEEQTPMRELLPSDCGGTVAEAPGSDPAAGTVLLSWCDGHAVPLVASSATHLRVETNFAGATSVVVIGLRDLAGLRSAAAEALRVGSMDASSALNLLARRAGAGRAESPWAESNGFTRALCVGCVLVVEEIANEYAPAFLSSEGRIVLSPPTHETGQTVQVWMFDERLHRVPFDYLPSGIERWVALIVELALKDVVRRFLDPKIARVIYSALTETHSALVWSTRQLWQEATAGPEQIPVSESVISAVRDVIRGSDDEAGEREECIALLLADEPELHLHPSAQEEVVSWAVRSRDRWTTIVATHAAPFLKLAASEGRIVRVQRQPPFGTTAVQLGRVVLEGLDTLSEDLGLGRDRLLQLVRGLVLVEGITDKAVIESFGRDILERQRLLVVPLGGHTQARNVVQGEFALALGLPLAVIFDEVTREDLAAIGLDPKARVSEETKSAQKLLDQRDRGLNCTILPFNEPDICAALPEALVRERFPKFKSWASVHDSAKRAPDRKFKELFLESIYVNKRDDAKTIINIAESWDGKTELPLSISSTLLELDQWAGGLASRALREVSADLDGE